MGTDIRVFKEPLLAASVKPTKNETLNEAIEKMLDSLQYPVAATVKIDGIRALKLGDSMVTRKFKDVPNVRLRKILADLLPEGADGEVVAGTTFQDVSKTVMKSKGTENFDGKFTYYWFDMLTTDASVTYEMRMSNMQRYIEQHPEILKHEQATIVPLFPTIVPNKEQLLHMETQALSDGFEGLMLRRIDGKYKMGRASMKEGILIKLKRFEDAEAEVIGFEELNHNNNEATKDAFGRTKRSTKKAGLVQGGTLAALVVRSPEGIEFNIGTGFDGQQRQDIWDNQSSYLGKQVKYKFFPTGVKTAPRFPTFLGWRED